MVIQALDDINIQTIEELEKHIQIPMVVLNDQQLLFANKTFIDKLMILDYENEKNQIFSFLKNIPIHRKSELYITANNGSSFWFEVTAKHILFENNRATLAVLMDISDRKIYEQNVTRIAKLRALVIKISQSILDSHDLNVFFNSVLTNTLKAIEKSTLGTILVLDGEYLKTTASFGYSQEINQFQVLLTESFIYKESKGHLDKIVNIEDTEALSYYLPVETAYGEQVFIKSSLSAPIFFHGKLYGTINIDSIEKQAFDQYDVQSLQFIRNSIEVAITNRLLYEEKAYLSKYDQTTGLHNRHFFEEHSEYVLKRAIRYQEGFNLVMIDIDNLKQVNDQYGHIVGDKLIQKVSNQLKHDLRDSDIFARYGGDEFIGLLLNANYNDSYSKLKKISQQIQQSLLKHHNITIMCSISFGIASFPEDGNTINDLIRVADFRMYSHKEQNKQ